MNTTQYGQVLAALETRDQRYKNNGNPVDYDKQLDNDALDETGTFSTSELTNKELTDGTIDGQQIQYTEQLEVTEIRGVADELLKVHGIAPEKKSDRVTRLVMENPNGFNTTIRNNTKLGIPREIIDELEADVVAYTGPRINCRHKRNRNGMSQMFQGGETEIRTLVGHNKHENISRVQEGAAAS